MNYIIFFLILLLINFILFSLYKKVKIIDNSMKFNNAPTQTSGGLIFLVNLLVGVIYFSFFFDEFKSALPENSLLKVFFLLILFLFSICDDIKPIDPKIKLFAQFFFIYFASSLLKVNEIELHYKLALFICVFLWVYILNITNFIDGSDGFLNTNMFFVFISVIFINYHFGLNTLSKYIALIILPCTIVFFFFNSPNAKIYLGDTGSTFYGIINGFIFLEFCILKLYLIAISLIIYPLLDCTLTLFKRVYNKKVPWVGEPDYYFSKAQLVNINNKNFIFKYNIIFNIINLILIGLQIYLSYFFFIINIILTISFLVIYSKKK